jgi:hypothetical protein
MNMSMWNKITGAMKNISSGINEKLNNKEIGTAAIGASTSLIGMTVVGIATPPVVVTQTATGVVLTSTVATGGAAVAVKVGSVMVGVGALMVVGAFSSGFVRGFKKGMDSTK